MILVAHMQVMLNLSSSFMIEGLNSQYENSLFEIDMELRAKSDKKGARGLDPSLLSQYASRVIAIIGDIRDKGDPRCQ